MKNFENLKSTISKINSTPEIVKNIMEFLQEKENVNLFKEFPADSLKNIKDVIASLNIDKAHKDTIFIYIQNYLNSIV